METPLHRACIRNKKFEVVKILVKAGADINSRDSKGLSPLGYAAKGNYDCRVLKLLLDKGA